MITVVLGNKNGKREQVSFSKRSDAFIFAVNAIVHEWSVPLAVTDGFQVAWEMTNQDTEQTVRNSLIKLWSLSKREEKECARTKH